MFLICITKTQHYYGLFIKFRCPQLKKVHYFSDGCAGQFKNRYNFNFYRSNYELKCEKVGQIDAQLINMVCSYMLVT